jgi:hypothetical protein
MSKTKRINASLLAASLIEEQLDALSITIAAVAKAYEAGKVERHYLERVLSHRKLRLVKTASGGNIVADKADHPDKSPDPLADVPLRTRNDDGKHDSLRVVVGNSLIAIGAFMRAHDMLDMRTPEFQFLGHAVEALLNGNTFRIDEGYMPVASFDGLVIDHRLDGHLLFAQGNTQGFMELGDALALMQWMQRYLRGEMGYVSGGDAG